MSPIPEGPFKEDLELRAKNAEDLIDQILGKMKPGECSAEALGNYGTALNGLVATLEYTRDRIMLHQAGTA